MDIYTCCECGFQSPMGPGNDTTCNKCGSPMLQNDSTVTQNADDQTAPILMPETYKPVFNGSASEYFRIWIVNVFLTTITLGIYAAWARVRTRRYFYANTQLAGHCFDYLADPLRILKGNLIIGTAFILYTLSDYFKPGISSLVLLAFYLILPFLVYKALRFFAYNSAYRNIRFNFLGTCSESYKVYLWTALLTVLTLGLATPYWAFLRKQYYFGNMAFGNTRNRFSGSSRDFWSFYIVAGLWMILVIGIFSASIFAPMATLIKQGESAEPGMAFFISFACGYTVLILGIALIQQYLYARTTNYCWSKSNLGGLRFESTLNPAKLVYIRFTNILAMTFSLGLLIPWAKIRRTRYILDNLKVIAGQSLDDFGAGVDQGESALGDVATDFFDLDIGF